MTDTMLPETAQPEPVRLPPLGPLGWARWAWRQLTSMRVALLLLMLLAVAAVPGSVFPQRRIDPTKVDGYLAEHTTSGPWLDRLGAFDVYSSPWFSAVYLLLFVSLVGCVVPRAKQHWKNARSAPPRTPRRLERLPAHASATVDATPDEALEKARTALRRRRFRLAEHDGGTSLAGEKGYSAETGNLAFHLALLGLLVAIAAGSLVGYSGQVTVVEGQPFSNVAVMYNTLTAGSRVDTGDLPPFSLTLDSLKVDFDDGSGGGQLGAPRMFTGAVTVADAGGPPSTRSLKVNQPVDVGGTRLFLVGNGYAPVLTVRDGDGNVAFSGAVPFLPRDSQYTSLGVVKVPDAAPRQIALRGLFLPTAIVDPVKGPVSIFPGLTDPRLFLTAYVSAPGEDGLGLDSGVPQSVYELDDKDLTQLTDAEGEPLRILLAPGTTFDLPDGAGSVTFDGVKRYAALDIRYDPTKVWVLAFAVLALAGLTTSLFVRRRRLWARVSTDGEGRTVVEVGGLSRGDDTALEPLVREVLAEVAGPAPVRQGAAPRGTNEAHDTNDTQHPQHQDDEE
jgi:cytochrome c biogenesis protein